MSFIDFSDHVSFLSIDKASKLKPYCLFFEHHLRYVLLSWINQSLLRKIWNYSGLPRGKGETFSSCVPKNLANSSLGLENVFLEKTNLQHNTVNVAKGDVCRETFGTHRKVEPLETWKNCRTKYLIRWIYKIKILIRRHLHIFASNFKRIKSNFKKINTNFKKINSNFKQKAWKKVFELFEIGLYLFLKLEEKRCSTLAKIGSFKKTWEK